ncbi:M14 family zinc carboxypeptidase [Paraconexibacter algicola]|uniref:Carboxypeptidase n=1 Tax=Paraconexibacter algicola TaxID=2133960 RepID=A0A2T4ULM3_9ACTN|nr:M14 family zinc carboxypeptidase [Paraconexibacter algicola]PTL60104.1 carboxypeptidase [Paraconexibacter algicola]
MRRWLLLALLLALALPGVAAAAVPCTPGGAPLPAVPTWEAVNGFPLGERQATNAEIERYVAAVDAASDRVDAGIAGRSVDGRALPVVHVGAPEHVTPAGRRRIGARARALRDARPGTPRVRPDDTAIVWIAAGVHGNEPSATDAHMRILYDLASTTDCARTVRLDRLLTVLFPLQNPDGRVLGQRTNGYRFDLNRDWFARTQPETRVKIDLLERYPPIAFVDGHEQAGDGAFFPPNADPIHHEIPDGPLRQINAVYGPALRAAMDAAGRDYTNYTTYDLFFMGFGDTVPTTLYGAAGMTFEKGGQDVYPAKVQEHGLLADTVLAVAAQGRTALLREWAAQWTAARRQGARGVLEPNVVVQPTNTVRFPVPRERVYAHVLRAGRHAADVAVLAQRLRTVGVEVLRLRGPLRTRMRALGAPRATTVTLPAGTYVVPMDQSRKHWVQALLADDAHVPFPYFYDVSGWSNPLLMGLDGGVLHAPLRAADRRLLRPVGVGASPAPSLPAAPAYAVDADALESLRLVLALQRAGVTVRRASAPFRDRGRRHRRGTAIVAGGSTTRALLRRGAGRHHTAVTALSTASPAGAAPVTVPTPKVAVLRDPTGTVGDTTVPDVGLPLGGPGAAAALAPSEGWVRWLLERELGVDVVRVAETELGTLASRGITTLVVPDAALGAPTLTALGLRAVQDFVRAGGTYVGLRAQGLGVAQAAGLTSARTVAAPRGFQVPGVSIAVRVDDRSPVTWGLGGRSWVFNTGDPIVERGSSRGREAVAYAPAGALVISGYAEGTEVLAGTPVVLDERFGAGRAVIFTVDAAFRGSVEGTERMLANAVLAPPGLGARARPRTATPRVPVRPELVARTVGAAAGATDAVVRVGPADEARLRAAVRTLDLGPAARVTA